jgi:hypothetical protein
MFSCDNCELEFKFKSQFIRHRDFTKCGKGISSDEIFSCETCNAEFKHKRSLQRHISENRCSNQKYNHNRIDNSNVNVNSTGDNANIVTGDNNTINITNNITNNNQTYIIIRPFGYEDISFLTHEEMLKILLSKKSEIDLIEKLLSKEENINFFKHNQHERFVSSLTKTYKIKSLPQEKFKDQMFNNANERVVALFYKCKDKLDVFSTISIACKIWSPDNNFDANEYTQDINAKIHETTRDLKKTEHIKAIKAISEIYEKVPEVKQLLETALENIKTLRKEIKEDFEAIHKKGLSHDVLDVEKDEYVDENNNVVPRDISTYDKFKAAIDDEVKRLKYLEKHNTLLNIKEHVMRLFYKKVDDKVYEDARYYFEQEKKLAERAFIEKQLSYLEKERKQRDKDIDDELVNNSIRLEYEDDEENEVENEVENDVENEEE